MPFLHKNSWNVYPHSLWKCLASSRCSVHVCLINYKIVSFIWKHWMCLNRYSYLGRWNQNFIDNHWVVFWHKKISNVKRDVVFFSLFVSNSFGLEMETWHLESKRIETSLHGFLHFYMLPYFNRILTCLRTGIWPVLFSAEICLLSTEHSSCSIVIG